MENLEVKENWEKVFGWTVFMDNLEWFGCNGLGKQTTGNGVDVEVSWNQEEKGYWFKFKSHEDWVRAEEI